MLGVSLDDLITDCIMGMRTVAKEIGLGRVYNKKAGSIRTGLLHIFQKIITEF